MVSLVSLTVCHSVSKKLMELNDSMSVEIYQY